MKKIIYCLFFLLPAYILTIGCESGDYGGLWSESEPQPLIPCQIEIFDEEMADPRDGQAYGVVNINSTYWMAENLNYETDDSWNYKNSSGLGEIYGQLYTWDAARQACPEGWRLPTDEEWIEMVMYFHSDFDTSQYSTTVDRLFTCSSNGFNVLLGGYRRPSGYSKDLGVYGYYWSGTEQGTQEAWSYVFSSGHRLGRRNLPKSNGYSCRCIKN